MNCNVGRTPEGIQLLTIGEQEPKGICGTGSAIMCTEDGSRLLSAFQGSVRLVDLDSAEAVTEVQEEGVVLSSLSNTGAFLVTCQRPGKAEDGSPAKNLKGWGRGEGRVWDLATGACVFSHAAKQVNKDSWPLLHWTSDDQAFMHVVTNTVHVYGRSDGFSAYRKVTIKGIGGLALSPVPFGAVTTNTTPQQPQPLPLLAAFLPEVKGSPAGAGIYALEGAGAVLVPEPQPLVRKSFFRSQGAKLMWNSRGSACLVLSYADFDATNQSYYGEQKLHYLPADPARSDEAVTVPLPKEGPVHDVQWSPTGDYFITVAGFMPAKVTLFNAACKPVYDLGSGPYNLVRWNPFGRFFAIAGFGNLPGDIVFYDKKTSGTCKQMGAVRSPAVSAEWSPDGRLLLTATTAPRLRVDNNIKVFTYHGEERLHQRFETLLEARWRPAPRGAFQDRPQSPERLEAVAKGGEAVVAAPTKPSYVPPHLRAAGVSSVAPNPRFNLARDEDDKPGKIKTGSGRSALPPGAEFVAAGNGKAASKNAKRRARKKGGAAGGSDDPEGDGAVEGDEAAEGPSPSGAPAALAAEQAAAAVASTSLQGSQHSAVSQSAGEMDEEARQKRIRALQKKQRQIQELKDKISAQGDKALTPEQREKLASEKAILDELASLGA
ncbi:eukaryotic translation initiation factor [Volvox carteri f. nagariensis]|uniref:Eukaryotic translation initiation factor 2A n=1 Tax=Volvox carteri f. nagariensis TaxID=3068 RepID=D8U2W7_VOLCA|nr:eukaryotic translation initiation factor [Volvox carteri f. nagariensis]EFJ45878.1 eukaryotic translation initiation factor [Volvox carteri f. nagariensis]|eukprot:XP_002952956.1 eukaryotic translation initiation factor [Volvox carteri f. nagariensis]